MANGRITKRSVDALSCPAGKDRAFLWDDTLSGFGVAAFPTGRRIYVAQYRQDGRSRRTSLGEHGRLTPEEARAAAKKLLGAVANGADPVGQRKNERSAPTFREVSAAFMAQHVNTKRKTRTAEAYECLLRTHVLPSIGTKRLAEIKRAQISKLHHDMANTPGAANRALSVVSAIWNWWSAENDDSAALARNPAKGVKRYPEEGRERFLSIDELALLGEVLHQAETVGLIYEVDKAKPKAKHAPKPANRRRVIDPFAIAAVRLLVLTGARLNEIMTAKWSFVDFERGLLNLPTSKSGKKVVFLGAAALEVLAGLPRISGNEHIIAGSMRGTARSDLKRPWAAISAAATLEGMRIHDLRHSFAAVGAGASLGLPVIGKLLGHSQPSTTQRYAHLGNDPLRRAVDTIGSVIAGAMNHRSVAAVVPLRAEVSTVQPTSGPKRSPMPR